MKHSSLALFFLLLFTTPGLARTNRTNNEEQSVKRDKVPAPVLSAFTKSYPKAHIRGYSKEKEGGKTVYEIESLDGDLHRDVLYTADGTVISIEESLPFAQLPKPVRDAVSREYPHANVIKAERLLKGENILFEVLVKSGKRTIEQVYGPDGKLVNMND